MVTSSFWSESAQPATDAWGTQHASLQPVDGDAALASLLLMRVRSRCYDIFITCQGSCFTRGRTDSNERAGLNFTGLNFTDQ